MLEAALVGEAPVLECCNYLLDVQKADSCDSFRPRIVTAFTLLIGYESSGPDENTTTHLFGSRNLILEEHHNLRASDGESGDIAPGWICCYHPCLVSIPPLSIGSDVALICHMSRFVALFLCRNILICGSCISFKGGVRILVDGRARGWFGGAGAQQ